ncbi:hypothetical protein [Aeromicrobium sp.]|uniref:hypothetical protein n=1 Tax=Aeromicrobium sp. TaxID=1871063 RepID=UPI0019A5C03D|nr:hypothetical protein [Aeromicrobium sp.]MBC7633415.1 hypothetical protein [Aeromicrobium sp.]
MNPRYRRLLIPGLLVALLAIVVVSSLARRADGAQSGSVVVSHISDPRITESSGLVVSSADADLAYTINDSGNAPVVFTVRVSTGAVVGTTTVSGGTWFDTEAMATGPDGTLWVADTGDNDGNRSDAALYSLAQPTAGDRSVVARRYPITYPDGPENVEALIINPSTGRKLLVSKGVFAGGVFALPDALSTTTANRAKDLGVVVPALITDGAFANSGNHVVLRNYSTAYVYDTASWSSVDSEPMPDVEQGETLAMEASGQAFLVGSEGTDSPLIRVPFEEPTSTSATSGTPTRAAPTPTATSPTAPLPGGNGFAGATWFWAVGVMALLAGISVAINRKN